METKFIENTNEQYSIREDGVVIRHYTRNYNINTKTIDKIVLNIEILRDNKGVVFIGNGKRVSVNKLLRLYFKHVYCIKCNSKVEDLGIGKRTKSLCNNCIAIPKKRIYIKKPIKPLLTDEEKKVNLALSRKRWITNNPLKYANNIKRINSKRITELPKCEIAWRLGLKASELTDDLYNLHKTQIELKRLLSQKTGLHYSNFK
jgi:hypothetical protein